MLMVLFRGMGEDRLWGREGLCDGVPGTEMLLFERQLLLRYVQNPRRMPYTNICGR